MFRLIAESTRAIPFSLDLTRGCFLYIGAQGVADSGLAESQMKEPGALDLVIPRVSNHRRALFIGEARRPVSPKARGSLLHAP
jgi:hypothetical protein